jgi:hypothetical protein
LKLFCIGLSVIRSHTQIHATRVPISRKLHEPKKLGGSSTFSKRIADRCLA